MYTTNSLTNTDIQIQGIGEGETLVILQRCSPTVREQDERLSNEDILKVESATDEIMKKIQSEIGIEKMKTIDLLFVSADPRLGVHSVEQTRSIAPLLTARAALETMKQRCVEYGFDKSNILNNTASHGKDVVEISEIKSYREFVDFPGLYEFFKVKSEETGQPTYTLYQQQTYKDERDRVGVEDADSMGRRLEQFLSFSRISTNYHQHNPSRRLILWAVSNFDTITPLMDRIALRPSDCSELIPVDHLGGITISIDLQRNGRVHMLNKEYPITINYDAIAG